MGCHGSGFFFFPCAREDRKDTAKLKENDITVVPGNQKKKKKQKVLITLIRLRGTCGEAVFTFHANKILALQLRKGYSGDTVVIAETILQQQW